MLKSEGGSGLESCRSNRARPYTLLATRAQTVRSSKGSYGLKYLLKDQWFPGWNSPVKNPNGNRNGAVLELRW